MSLRIIKKSAGKQLVRICQASFWPFGFELLQHPAELTFSGISATVVQEVPSMGQHHEQVQVADWTPSAGLPLHNVSHVPQIFCQNIIYSGLQNITPERTNLIMLALALLLFVRL